MTEGICPSGWHIPSDEEFTELTDFLGGEGVAGGKMKEAGYDHWNHQIQALLIQAVGLVCLAATATPVLSSTMATTGTGGLLQSPVPTLGDVLCTATSAMSSGTTTIETSAFLLVASGIKT